MPGKKKLLHIIPSLSIGGAEKLIFNSISLFTEYEHDVITFSADPDFLSAIGQLAIVYMKK